MHSKLLILGALNYSTERDPMAVILSVHCVLFQRETFSQFPFIRLGLAWPGRGGLEVTRETLILICMKLRARLGWREQYVL